MNFWECCELSQLYLSMRSAAHGNKLVRCDHPHLAAFIRAPALLSVLCNGVESTDGKAGARIDETKLAGRRLFPFAIEPHGKEKLG